uniref:Uncharacterized protein n=1 Tax=Cacopsylla melanoneura TaxID=428564 RepID=A0A8D8X3B7_9HEMI
MWRICKPAISLLNLPLAQIFLSHFFCVVCPWVKISEQGQIVQIILGQSLYLFEFRGRGCGWLRPAEKWLSNLLIRRRETPLQMVHIIIQLIQFPLRMRRTLVCFGNVARNECLGRVYYGFR